LITTETVDEVLVITSSAYGQGFAALRRDFAGDLEPVGAASRREVRRAES
jgi:hypothetical protein